MKQLLVAVALIITATPLIAADVNVSLSVGQPGFYGQIDIGDYPPPRVLYRQPIMVERVEMDRQPIYLRVAPGHAKNWRRHCREYNACGERVYFVQDNWYRNEYAPRYQERHHDDRDDRRNNRHDRWKDDRGRGRNHRN